MKGNQCHNGLAEESRSFRKYKEEAQRKLRDRADKVRDDKELCNCDCRISRIVRRFSCIDDRLNNTVLRNDVDRNFSLTYTSSRRGPLSRHLCNMEARTPFGRSGTSQK